MGVKNHLRSVMTCVILSLLILSVVGLLDSRLGLIPMPVSASTYSGSGAYILKDRSKSYSYFVNSSTAGFLWYWDRRYPGIQNLGEGGHLRLHSNYGYDLKPESMGFSVVYWEYEDGITNNRVQSGSGDAVQTILRNASDFSLVKFTWSDSKMKHTYYYGFWSDKPYVWVYIERTMNSDMLAQNSQTCNMLSKNFKKFWWTDYVGQVENWNYTGTSFRYTQPMFSAVDTAAMNRYPFMALYSDSYDATVGFIYLDASPNIRKDTHIWGFELEPQYAEVQVDWGGENDGGRRYWRKDTTMGLEYLVFLKSGTPNKSGNIMDYSESLYNNATNAQSDVDSGMWSAVNHRFRSFQASESFPVGLCGHNVYVANNIGLQTRTYYIPYMDQVPLTQTSLMDEVYYNVPLYSRWFFRYNSGTRTEIDDQLVNESYNRTIAGIDSIIGMIGWDKGSITGFSHVKAFRDSDKLLFYGNVTLDVSSQCLDSSFILYFNKINAAVKISPKEYDLRFIDPLYGWSGIYLKVDVGAIQEYSDRLEIRLFNFTTPQTKTAGTAYAYNFTLWGHNGNRTSMSDFFTMQQLKFKRLFQNFALDNNEFGFESSKEYVVVNSTYSSSQLIVYLMNLTKGQKTVNALIRTKGIPDGVTVNGSPVSFNYDESTRILTFNAASSTLKRVVISWPTVDTQPPSFGNVGHNTTLIKSPCLFSSLWQDNSGLSGYIFSNNNTGMWANDTWLHLASNPAWANVTKTLNSLGDLVIGYRWYVNDSSNNWRDTGIFTLKTVWGDIQPPTYSNIQVNATVASNPALFSAYWQDQGGLSGYIFSTNNTGSWVNDTMAGLIGLTGWAKTTKTLDADVGTVVGYRWYCVDANGNWNDTGIRTLTTTYSAKPQYSHTSVSTTEQNRPSTFSSLWTDDQELGGYIFGTNATGGWMNDSFSSLSGKQGWANKTRNLPKAVGIRVEFQWWCSDSQGQWSTTGLQYIITTPGQPPTYSNIGYNSTLAGNRTLFSCRWQDSIGLSGFIFSWNGTGTWTNNTWIELVGLSAWSNVTKTLPSLNGKIVGFKWYCNDTDGNWKGTPIQALTTTTVTQSTVFGRTIIGANLNTVPVGYAVACKFQSPADGTATKISAYIRGKYQSGYVKAMIYSDVNGQIGILLFESSQITLQTAWAWHNFTVNYHIQSGGYYWFAIFASVESQFRYDAGQANQQAAAWGWSYPTVPQNFNGIYGPMYASNVDSSFVTYTADMKSMIATETGETMQTLANPTPQTETRNLTNMIATETYAQTVVTQMPIEKREEKRSGQTNNMVSNCSPVIGYCN